MSARFLRIIIVASTLSPFGPSFCSSSQSHFAVPLGSGGGGTTKASSQSHFLTEGTTKASSQSHFLTRD